jgi:hypothetical protein
VATGGAGKTVLADELAARVTRPVVRATVDAFLNPVAVRHARGRGSPEGFSRDSVDVATPTTSSSTRSARTAPAATARARSTTSPTRRSMSRRRRPRPAPPTRTRPPTAAMWRASGSTSPRPTPEARATRVVDNRDLDAPVLIR